jgi:hypothetical protein
MKDPKFQDESIMLMDREEAAVFLGQSKSTLGYWASSKPGYLPMVKIGSRVMYRVSDLRKFIEDRAKETQGG